VFCLVSHVVPTAIVCRTDTPQITSRFLRFSSSASDKVRHQPDRKQACPQILRLILRTNASDATYSVAGNRIASFGPARAEAQQSSIAYAVVGRKMRLPASSSLVRKNNLVSADTPSERPQLSHRHSGHSLRASVQQTRRATPTRLPPWGPRRSAWQNASSSLVRGIRLGRAGRILFLRSVRDFRGPAFLNEDDPNRQSRITNPNLPQYSRISAKS
jgi:hypothetical protein